MILTLAILMTQEWYELTVKNNKNNPQLWKMMGLFYVAIPCTSLIWISNQHNGNLIIIVLVLIVWATDTAAYFCGKIIGGKKLAPKISPNKTWSGLIGGVIAAMITGYYLKEFIGITRGKYFFLALCMTLAIYAQLGDLLESWIKRKFNIKDSGSLIPGHGGILDRVDGLTITAPKVALILLFHEWHIQWSVL
jgi:phosphatidate cytidylyltransferase